MPAGVAGDFWFFVRRAGFVFPESVCSGGDQAEPACQVSRPRTVSVLIGVRPGFQAPAEEPEAPGSVSERPVAEAAGGAAREEQPAAARLPRDERLPDRRLGHPAVQPAVLQVDGNARAERDRVGRFRGGSAGRIREPAVPQAE